MTYCDNDKKRHARELERRAMKLEYDLEKSSGDLFLFNKCNELWKTIAGLNRELRR